MDAWLQFLADQTATAPPLVIILLVLLGGLISSASPCVLATVPLAIAVIGGQASSRATSVRLSLAFSLGLAVCFTVLGVVAAIAGRLMSDVGWGWTIILGLILVAMGAQIAGFIHLPVPRMDHSRFQRAGLVGAFVLGALTGTLSAPCATPMLVVVLSIVAFQKQIMFGSLLLLTYSLGHVTLLFLAGAVSGFASAYLDGAGAKAARWLHLSLGVALVFAGLWLLGSQLRSLSRRSAASVPRKVYESDTNVIRFGLRG